MTTTPGRLGGDVSVRQLAEDLRALRARAGNPSLAAMARAGHSSPPTLSAVHTGYRLPTWEATLAYLRGCGVTVDEVTAWQNRWCEVADASGYRGDRPHLSASGVGPCPDVAGVTTIEQFRGRLHDVYRWTGAISQAVFLRAAAAHGVPVARTTLSDLLAVDRSTLPSRPSVQQFLLACRLPPPAVDRWVRVREALCAEYRASQSGSQAEDLFENAPCGYLTTLPDGTIVQVNRTFLTWSGYSRTDLVGVLRFDDLLSHGSRVYHETHFAPLLAAHDAVGEVAVDMVSAGGKPLPALMNAVLVRDDDGTPVRVRTMVLDASQRRSYEQELVRARRAAEAEVHRLRELGDSEDRVYPPGEPYPGSSPMPG